MDTSTKQAARYTIKQVQTKGLAPVINNYSIQKERVRFLVHRKAAEPELAKLQQVLSPFGFETQLKPTHQDPHSDEVHLEIVWNETSIHQRQTRNAGPPFADRSISWEQIDEWKKEGMTSTQIAQKLHVSRATYYNHLKLRECHPDYLYF